MKAIIFILAICFSSTVSFSQLDPQFFGSYVNEELTNGFLIYTMDEVASDCFLVEFELYQGLETISSETGYGHCDGPNGHMEIQLESKGGRKLEVGFSVDEAGFNLLTIYNSDGTTSDYFSLPMEEEIYDTAVEGENEEFVFVREDGAQLILYGVEGDVGFSLYGEENGSCEENAIEGIMLPLDDELTTFEYTMGKCKLEFQVSTDKINIIETNCKSENLNCSSVNGLYFLLEN
jgi:hypothetical protein